MMMATKLILTASVAGFLAVGALPTSAAFAAPKYRAHAAQRHAAPSAGVRYAQRPQRGGYRTLVSDGPGTGYGFHRSPAAVHYAAVNQRYRQADAVHDAVVTDALTSGDFRSGFLGDSVYANGNRASYGVFSGSDGYGSPYFAGYYGPGGGTDYGVFGSAYDD